MACATKSKLAVADGGRAAAVDLEDEHLPLAFGRRQRLEEWPRRVADGVHHSKHGARTRRPLVEVPEHRARREEGQLRTQPRHRHHDGWAEAGTQAQLTVDRQVRCGPSGFGEAADGTREVYLPEAGADT